MQFFLFMYRTLSQVAFAFFLTNVTPSVFHVPSHITLPSLTFGSRCTRTLFSGSAEAQLYPLLKHRVCQLYTRLSILFVLSLTLPLGCMLSLSIVINSTIFNMRRKYWCIAMKRKIKILILFYFILWKYPKHTSK